MNSLRVSSRGEDDFVRKLINKYGLKNWHKIARYLPPNVAEQYRERLSNFYKFDDNDEKFPLIANNENIHNNILQDSTDKAGDLSQEQVHKKNS